MMNQHEIFVLSGSSRQVYDLKSSRLDRFLSDLRSQGRRVLDFRRVGDRWVVKLMAVR